MKRRQFIICSTLYLLFGCQDDDEDEEEKCNDPMGCDGQLPVARIVSGMAEKGPFAKDADVTATAYDLDWDQSDFPKEGSTEHDDGSYQIYSEVSGSFVRMRIEGQSYNEVENRYDWVSLRDISRNDGSKKNLNPLTHILDMVSFKHCRDTEHQYYHDGDNCLALAKSEILDYLSFENFNVDFNQRSLQGDTTSDAQMSVFSWYIASGREGFEQNDHMREIANGILNNDLVLKQSISDFMWSMPFKKISDNLLNKYTELGISANRVPFWLLPQVPGYYADLLGRTPNVLDSINTGFVSGGIIDTSDYNIFAYPVEFTVTNPKYIALNLTGNLSIWSVGLHVDGYNKPATKIAELSLLNEVLLDDPVQLQYNYSIDSPVSPGLYFIVAEFPANVRPTKMIEGDLVPFGANMASSDMVDWIGWDNVTNWFRRSIKYISYD